MSIELKKVKDVYEIIAPHFSQKRISKWTWVTDFITTLPKNSIIYDIGCGSGRNMTYQNYYFIGIDNCEEFIKQCILKNLNVIQSDMTNIPLENRSSDAIISIASFHHLSSREIRVNALREMKRLIKDDGRILLSVWSIKQPEKLKKKRVFKYGDNFVKWHLSKVESIDRYYYIFKLDELKKLFQYVGLHIEKHFWEYGNEIFVLYL